MSREIKFRCFYKIDNTMLEVTEINFTGNAITPTCLFWSPELGLHEAPIEFERDFELMQYTGLKDKHSKEIYEGDIVKFDYRGLFLKGEVVFNSGGWELKGVDYGEHFRLIEIVHLCEVVGNIHQKEKIACENSYYEYLKGN